MNKRTVEVTKKSGLCCSCGICKGVCPKGCIEYQRKDGMYYPVIDNSKCIKCGICYDICPGLTHKYSGSDSLNAVEGVSISSYNAWSNNPEIRHVSASGGCISSLIVKLLKSEIYDFAVSLDTYNYKEQLKSTFIDADMIVDEYDKTSYPKSRYLPVSHEDTVRFILDNRDKKVIFIGTSCAVRGLINVIEKFKLNRDNYLLIGLFCDRVFNYNIYDYFNTFTDKGNLTSLHFKNKDSGGWPGNMKFFMSDGTEKFVDFSERMKMKEYFMPERCLYCVDKVNVEADISIGDNFTEFNSSKLGSNSVIIRTKRGSNAWELAGESITSVEVDVDAISKAQALDIRLNNACFAKIKQSFNKKLLNDLNLNDGIKLQDNTADYYRAYKTCIHKLRLGGKYDRKPEALSSYIKKQNDNGAIKRLSGLFSRIYHKFLRMTVLRFFIN